MPKETFELTVHGARETTRAFLRTDIAVSKELGVTLRAVAEPVKETTKALAMRWGESSSVQQKTAAGVRISRRGLRVSVEQSTRKSTDEAARRPNYGGVQMRHFFEPALAQHRTEIELRTEAIMLGLLTKTFELGGTGP